MNKKKILFIEDEPDQIMMVQARLEASDFDVISALDGEEGLKKAKEEKPDLVLLDLLMPKMDGYEVCEHLRKDPKTKKIPIVVMTASGAKDAQDRCRKSGADDFIKKPFESAELIAKIKTLTGS